MSVITESFYKNIIKKKGNVKLGNQVGTVSKLYGNKPVHVKDMNMEVVGTCGGYCYGCMESCYVRKSYRYPSVILGHARTTLALRANVRKFFESMDTQLNRMRKKLGLCRINQSGELESVEEFKGYIELAEKHPETIFWLYTKAYDLIWYDCFMDNIPQNLFVNISIWGECGIKEYLELSQHSNQVRAFVCVTKEYTETWYAAHGIVIDSWCHAYDINGKLNHDLTCDKCTLCFRTKHRVTGCYEH